jgi:hypothetical protein
MRRLTIQVPLLQQPPVYIVLAVVLVSLLPLALRVVGYEPVVSAAEPLEALPARPVLAPVLEPPRLAAVAPRLAAAELAPVDDGETWSRADVVGSDEGEVDEVEIVVLEDDEVDLEAPAPASVEPSPERPLDRAERAHASGHHPAAGFARRSHGLEPSAAARLVETKAACESQARQAARSAYRELPRGEARRQARRACRTAGILLL